MRQATRVCLLLALIASATAGNLSAHQAWHQLCCSSCSWTLQLHTHAWVAAAQLKECCKPGLLFDPSLDDMQLYPPAVDSSFLLEPA